MGRQRQNKSGSATTARRRLSAGSASPVRRSPRTCPRRDYSETRRRGSGISSRGSTNAHNDDLSQLTATIKITLVTPEGEMKYSGTRDLILTETSGNVLIRLGSAIPFIQGPGSTVAPVETVIPAPPTFDYVGFLARQRKRDAKIKKHDTEIRRLEAEYANLRRQHLLEEQRVAGKRYILETPWIAAEMERAAKKVKQKMEEASEGTSVGPSAQVRYSNPPAGGLGGQEFP